MVILAPKHVTRRLPTNNPFHSISFCRACVQCHTWLALRVPNAAVYLSTKSTIVWFRNLVKCFAEVKIAVQVMLSFIIANLETFEFLRSDTSQFAFYPHDHWPQWCACLRLLLFYSLLYISAIWKVLSHNFFLYSWCFTIQQLASQVQPTYTQKHHIWILDMQYMICMHITPCVKHSCLL